MSDDSRRDRRDGEEEAEDEDHGYAAGRALLDDVVVGASHDRSETYRDSWARGRPADP
jgi:hypothetical protein